MNGRTARDDRLNLRASREQTEVIRLAAQISEATVTEFVLGSAVAAAERVLVDRRWFELDDANWVAFHAALDRPAVLKPRSGTEQLAFDVRQRQPGGRYGFLLPLP